MLGRSADPNRLCAASLFLVVFLLISLPLLGLLISRQPIAPYLEFPPLTRHVPHATFSWPVFISLALLLAVVFVPCACRTISAIASTRRPMKETHAFPAWGWLGLLLIAITWSLAWTRLPWVATVQPFTFTPLWLGYIVVMNALTYRATGACLLANRPRYLLVLFLLSTMFWWFFEYLNRFVQNWYYVGIDEFSPSAYIFYATLSFSTVLPAVVSTVEWLRSAERLRAAFQNPTPIQVPLPASIGWVVFALAAAGLIGIGIWPDYLFSLLWVSPLLLVSALQAMLGQDTIFSGLRHGDWRTLCLPALAGLQCGFFWELWNWHSLAHWEYAIPYVDRFQIFEMPLLGYAGYLPFGLECVVLAELFDVNRRQ
jgi:hypothetical protein